ncbi:Ig-like domain-containing protein [Pseudenterobacter timonensis]|uniref:Ig-like domain-containing protein n=1 Tax=Pseudenterobacter timonensis TaxID=1755099 RepID=A0AAE4DPS1_9ENTR|nr:BapA/Bap/LapF family large adhesin [Pseudenterobacter timonensis]MDR9891583.1 Ig-like domain-containing protein [Pseudenterobacter timonensis]
MSQITVISKLTGVETTMEGSQVVLENPSIIKLHVDRADIARYARSNNDLVITLHSGETITIKNFYVADGQGASHLVLEESDGALWWVEEPATAAQYESIASTDVLLAEAGSEAVGGAAVWPWVLGAAAVAGGVAIAASGGGGGGDDDDDDDGNVGQPGQPGNPSQPDTTAPDAPTDLRFSSDGKTVSGTAEPNSTITLRDEAGNVVGSGKAGSDGKFAIELGLPLTNGETITATATDPSGNVSQTGEVTAPDLTAPDTPEILFATDDVGDMTGPLTSGQQTDDARPTLSGMGEAGTTITIYDNGKPIGTTTVKADGSWSFTPASPLGEGNHAITVTATDATGNTSPVSGAVNFVVDTVAPAAPVIVSATDDVALNTGTIASGATTNDPRPQLSGTGEPGSTITLYDNGQQIGSVEVGSDGTWRLTPDIDLSEGAHALTVRATDAAGNTGAASPAYNITVDLTAPGTPAISSVIDDVQPNSGTLTSGGSTNDARPQLSGTAEAGSTITIYDNGQAIGTVPVGSDGRWSFTPANNLSDGAHALTVRATDAAGNTGAASPAFTLTVDAAAPAAPSGFVLNDATDPQQGEVTNGGSTNDTLPTLSGRGEPGSTIVLYDRGTEIGTTQVAADGTWSIPLTTPLAEGSHSFTVTETDKAGNTSAMSQPLSVTVDTAPPETPEITLNEAGSQVTGTADANSIITITNENGVVLGTGRADANGSFTITLTPAQTAGETISAIASDDAGNQSQPATATARDTTPPIFTGEVVVSPDGTTVSGTTEPGSTVTIRDPQGNVIGTETAGENGEFTVPISPAQTNGETLQAIATDTIGNSSQPVTATAPDSTDPLAPGDLNVSSDGTTVTGTAEAGSTVSIKDASGNEIGTGQADDQGNFSVTITPAQLNGESLTADATDKAGNTGPTAPVTAPDITPAQTPVITDVTDNAPQTTGSVAQNGLTNDTTPTVTGTGEPGTTITLYSGNTVIGTGEVNADGNWSITPVEALAQGGHVFSATATDATGNVSPTASNNWSITIDAAAPQVAVVTQVVDDVPGTLGAIDLNGITNDNRPTINGSGEPGSTISIRIDGLQVGTAVVSDSGAWSFTPTLALQDGQHTLTTLAIDSAGNPSEPSAGFTFTVETTPPDAAVLGSVLDNVGDVQTPITSGTPTDDSQPTLQGTAPEDATITVYDGTTLLGTATRDGASWSFTPETPLTDGTHVLTIRTTDAAGNIAITGPFNLVIDTVAPATPEAPAIVVNPEGTPVALNPGETTRDTTPTLSGTGNPGDTVTIYDGTAPIGTTTINPDGSWSWTPEDPLPNGTYNLSLTVTNQDGAGNESAPSQPIAVVIDTEAPAAPGTPLVTDSVTDVTGPVDNGGSTNDTRPVLSGTGATPNDLIIITDTVNGVATEIGRVTVGPDGSWSLRPETELGEGTHTITVTATDEAGNISDASSPMVITVDTQASPVPVITGVDGIASGGATTDTTPTLNGTGTSGDTIIIYNNGVEIARETVADGVWSWTPDAALGEVTLNLTAASVDAAGNISAASPVYTLTVDTTAPAAPQVIAISDSTLANGVLYTTETTPTITGRAEAGSTVTISINGEEQAEPVIADENGNWSWTPDAPLAQAVTTIGVSATDAAGNTTPGTPVSVTVDATPPADPTVTAVAAEGTPLTGIAEAGATVIVTSGSVELGRGVADGAGNYSIALSPAPANGDDLNVQAVDAAGNTSGTTSFEVAGVNDTVVDAPVITAITAEDIEVSGGSTNDATPVISGTAVAGSTVNIYLDGSATPVATIVATDDGTWSYPVPENAALGEGLHSFTATATLGGVTSGLSGAATVTVDLTDPDAPTIDAVTDDLAPFTGPLTSGDATNDTRPTLSGTGTAGETITLYEGDSVLGSVVIGPTGNWSITPTAALDSGEHILTITTTDAAGNESIPSAGFTVVVDTLSTTPVITNAQDNVGSVTDAVLTGGVTDDATPTLTGTAEANSTVAIFEGGTQIGTVLADGTGAWSFTPGTPLAAGLHSFTAVVTDPQGNISTASQPFNVTIDVAPPAIPTIDSVSDNVDGGATGNLTTGQVTNDATPTLSGTGAPGSTVNIFNGTTQLTTVVVQDNGSWSYTPNPALADGTYNIRVNASDEAGNVSASSPVFAFTVDTAAPVAPVLTATLDDVGPVTGTLTGGDSTNDDRPTFNGTGEVGSTIRILLDGEEIGTAEVNAQGNWTFTPTTPFSAGTHEVTFDATDAAGNTVEAGTPFSLTVDTTAPVTPAIVNATDNVGTVLTPVTSGQSTDDTTPVLNGTAEANATVIVYENGVEVGRTTADGTGAWSITPAALTSGSHTFTATATDAAGNVGPESAPFTVVVDTAAPLAPVIAQATDDVNSATGSFASGQATDDTRPQLSGTSEPNATVNIYEGATLLGTAQADASGAWNLTLNTALDEGTHTLVARATDAAGNTSPDSASFSLVVDLTPPALPVLVSITDDVGGNATLTSGQVTNDAQPTLSGTADVGSTVTIYDGTTPIGSVVATDGTWSFTPLTPLDDGPHTLTLTATDPAGNASAPTTGFVVNVDTTAPAAPVITTVLDDVGTLTGPVTGGNPTNDTRPTLNGTAAAGSTVNIYDGTTLVGTVTADGSGNWSLPQTSTTLSEGQHDFTATATDAAGNTSVASPVTSIVVDITAPALPTALAVVNNGTRVTGTAEAGSTVTITSADGATVLGSATADGSGNFTVTITPPQTNGEALLAFATDRAGNAGAPESVTAPITTLPNAPLIATINDNIGTITGNITNGRSTDDTTPTLSGTAQANSTVTLYNNGVVMGSVTADASGNWSFTTPALDDGTHAFTATAANATGTGPVSAPTTVIVDTIAPTAPSGSFNADGSVLTGTAEAGSTVTIRLGDNSTVTTTADANGSYSYTFLNKQTEGQTLQITATDAAGNVSLPGSAVAPVVPLSASTNLEEMALTSTATVTNEQYSDYGVLLVGAADNVLTLLGNDTAQVGFTVANGGSADISVNANATGVVLSLLNTLELVVQRFDAANNTWTTVVDTSNPQFADLLTLGASGATLNLAGLTGGQYRVLSYNTSLLATGSYTSLDVDVTQTSAGTLVGSTTQTGNVILDVDPTTGSDNAPAGTTVTAVTNAQGETTNVTANGTVIQGQYGTLTINLDGSYSYTLTSNSASVLGRTESFTYTIGSNGATASASLVISLGANTVTNSVTAVDDVNSLTFDTTVSAIDNGPSSQGGFTVVGVNLGNTLGLNLLDDLSNPIVYNVEEGTTRTMTVQASVGGVALASVFDLYIYKFNNATQTFEQLRVEQGWLRAPLLGGTSPRLTLNLPAGEYLFLLNTAAGITALTGYTLNVLEDHVYSVASVGASTTGDVLADDIVPTGTLVTEVNGVAVNANGLTTVQGEYGTLSINAQGEYTYTLRSGVGADGIDTPDTFVYTVTAPNGDRDTASLNITPAPRPVDAVSDTSEIMDVTSVHRTAAYSDTTVGSASWNAALLSSTQGSGNGTFVVDPNTALHNVVLTFNVASLLSLGGLTVDWTLTNGTTTIRNGSFNGGLLLGGRATINLTGLDLEAGTYTLSYTGRMGPLGVGNITVTPSVTGTSYSLSQFDATGTHTVDGNIFDGTDSAGAMDQLQSVDTRLSITGYNGVTTTLDPYTTSSANATIQGHYGTLSIGADGQYTYTLNNGVSLSTITSKEVFNYTLTDGSGRTESASLTINMAPQFVSSEHNDLINGTAYGDTLIYQVLNNTVGNATAGNSNGDRWTNFSLEQGDKIDISDLLVGWNGSAATLGNYLQVSTSGNNTVISVDRDGAGTAYAKTPLVTLDNVQTNYEELVNQQHIITG